MNQNFNTYIDAMEAGLAAAKKWIGREHPMCGELIRLDEPWDL
jgi:hypothetical protein